MKRTPLKRVSTKRKAMNIKRSAFVQEQLRKRPLCESAEVASARLQLLPPSYVEMAALKEAVHALRMMCEYEATELHEPLLRSRAPGIETITSVENSVAICRVCHRWVHDHPALATRLGLMRSGHGRE